MTACPSCGAGNPAGAKFCNQCGTRLQGVPAGPAPGPALGPALGSYTPPHLVEKVLKTRAALTGERKRVTVLFADIKGSTALAEQAGAEAWHVILDRFFTILTSAVHRYEGTVNQYTGDGIMALFGAPIAHEDHAVRAGHAALEMQAQVRRYADELRLRQSLNLSMRVGLNTGEVVVGRIGDDLRMDYTAQGLTVNLAARMEHICEPGHIYLTRNTAALVEGYFRLRDLGAMDVAGAAQPIAVYDLEGPGVMRTRLQRQLARLGSRFIGREKEMACLQAALERARSGQGQVVAVVGNAGIGKSRLCHEFAETCERMGVPVHRATGVPYSAALPLFPVQTLLKSRLGLPERAPAADVRRLVAGTFLLQDPANAAILPTILDFLGAAEPGEGAPEQAAVARERLFELLSRWIPRADAPQILLLEDLQYADAGTEEFLALLCREVPRTRTLLLVNYRTDYVNEWLIPYLDEQIPVTALTDEQICDLARNALGGHPSLEGVAERICARANGNPYYAEEAVQDLAESGHIEGQSGAYVLVKPIAQWRIPDTVHALIAARIDRLSEAHKTLLQTAAVIGQEFGRRLLVSVASLDEEPFESGLATLEESGFVHLRLEEPEPKYAFCHPLVQEVAYHAQLESLRAVAHARLAAALEAEHPVNGPRAEAWVQIAHHWRLAGAWAKAGAWNLAAARWTLSRDLQATLHQFRDAVQNLDRAPDSPDVIKQRIAARAGLIRMGQFVQIEVAELEHAFHEARQMAERLGDTPSLAELLISYGNEQLHRGDADAAAERVAEAVHLALAAGAKELVNRFRLAILLTHNAAGRPRDGLALVNAAGDGWIKEPIGEENCMSRSFYGLMLLWLGRLKEAEEHLTGAVDFAEREGRAESWMHGNLVDYAWFTGRYDQALGRARAAIRRAEASGSPFFRALALRALGLAHCLHNEHAAAIPFLEEGRLLVAPGALAHQFESNLLAVLAEAYLGAGRVAEAAATAQAGIASAQRSHSRVWEIRCWLPYLQLPPESLSAVRAQEGLARVENLIEYAGAVGLLPWLYLAHSRWARDETTRDDWRRRAVEEFARIGAHGHVERLSSKLGREGDDGGSVVNQKFNK